MHCPGPSHSNGDSNPSLTVHEGAGGKLLVHCKAGCSQASIVEALKAQNIWPSQPTERPALKLVPKVPEPPQAAFQLVSQYEYRDSSGQVVAIKGRFETAQGVKRFVWKRPNINGWPSGDSGVSVAETPLYGADLVSAANPDTPIVYCEGEKAADRCRKHGLLAVTFGGGASTTNFGEALNILAGRTVLLWPDNDSVGRAYMARVEAALRPITRSVRIVQVPYQEEHDDAVEYFERGGTVENVLALAPVVTSSVEWVSDDAVTVRQPSSVGNITFAFTDIEYSARSIDAEIAVSLSGPGLESVSVGQRINVLSGSAVSDFRRVLDNTFDREPKFWTVPLNHAISALRNALASHDPSIAIGDIEPPGPVNYLIEGMIPAEQPVLIFGKGSAAKGWLALRMALGMTVTGDFLGRRCRKVAALYLDYEDSKGTFRRRSQRLLAGLGLPPTALNGVPLYYFPAKGVPLVNLVQTLKQKVIRHGIEILFIDSVVAACGGRPEEAETAQRYFNALAKLGIASISIAHLSKMSDGTTPFGSVYFENFPRRTMLVTRSGEGNDFTLGITPKKVNDVSMMGSLGMRLIFDDPDGPITTTYADAKDEPELVARMGMREQLIAALREHAKTVAELVDELGAREEAVRTTLYRYRGVEFENLSPGKGNGAAALWGLSAKRRAS